MEEPKGGAGGAVTGGEGRARARVVVGEEDWGTLVLSEVERRPPYSRTLLS